MAKCLVTPVRIRRGLYRLDGVTHGARYPGGPVCGGRIFAESIDANGRPFSSERYYRWECYCETCLECDANGHATLKLCATVAGQYWS